MPYATHDLALPAQEDTTPARRSSLRAVARLFVFLSLTCAWAARYIFHGVRRGFDPVEAADFGRRWSIQLARVLGLKVSYSGELPAEPCLLVANHRSYMDITAMYSLLPLSFMAKVEVSRWPFIGFITRLGPTIFVDRDKTESRKTSRENLRRMIVENGLPAVVFPEGTSFEGPGILPFRPGSFFMAREAEIPVVPVAVHYEDVDDAWVGDDSFLGHFLRQLAKPNIRIHLVFTDPIAEGSGDDVRDGAENRIRSALSVLEGGAS
ncbi:MAG: 1-acyl-sn-glycerol-3-phosphate acyltransferase [Deltaproteobacteria bacterium]|nr:1-acyl-sn-glycerol-3-phosphate acyltransferase [Deltaproteobacteria bacterium]